MPEVFRPNRTAVGTCGASERLCRRHEKEISQLSCPFVCSVYLCQQRMEMLGSLVSAIYEVLYGRLQLYVPDFFLLHAVNEK